MKTIHQVVSRVIVILLLLSFFYKNAHAQAPGCPDINAGPDQTIDCATPCVNLQSTFLETGETSSYDYMAIPYVPPFAFNTGTQLFIGIDDVYSDAISIPFNFCFYGNTYNSLVVGTNGIISFDMALANQYCEWAYSATAPDPMLPLNAIFCAYHDIDPAVNGAISYMITGTAPCRMFVLNFNAVPHFSCNNLTTTQQVVIYETTNVIEYYVQDKPVCNGWNNGNALLGVQNASGTAATTPAGYNTGPWSATNLAYRIFPNGTPAYTISWYDAAGAMIGTGDNVNVCPTTTTSFTAEIVYTNCDGAQITVTDDVNVDVAPSFTLSETLTNVSCGGSCDGAISLTASGGAAPYTYYWSNIGIGTDSQSALCGGTYTVTVTDNSNCSSIGNYAIAPAGSVSVSTTTTDISCNGASDGTANITATGGNPPFTYLWSNGSSASSQSGLAAGIWFVTATDQSGCVAINSVAIAQPAAMTSNITVTDVNCNGACNGSTVVTASGGLGALTYLWSNAATGSTLANLCANTYTVTVTDASGCTVTNSGAVSEPSLLSISLVSVSNVSCGAGCDGGLSINSSGGTPPYVYTWSNGAVATTNQTGLCGGSYSITLTDDHGCTTFDSYLLTSASPFNISIASTDVTCSGAFDGSYSVTTAAGTSPFTYIWSDGNTAASASGLAAAPYGLTVTDQNGCIEYGSVTITEQSSIITDLTISDIDCNGACNGAAVLSVSGGTSGYTFLWSNGMTAQNLSSLCTGILNVTITDAAGCSTTNGGAVSAPNAVSITLVSQSDISCANWCDGSVTVSASGGSQPFSYSAFGLVQNNGSFSNLCAGAFTVQATDQAGCTTMVNGNLTEPLGINITVTSSDSYCDLPNGTAEVTNASGGAGTYNYVWSVYGSLVNGSQVSNLNQGVYNVSVFDTGVGSLCYVTSSVTLSTLAPYQTSVVTSDPLCAGSNDGWVEVTVQSNYGPSSMYNYLWSNGAPNSALNSGISGGVYNVSVMDNLGCLVVNSGTIIEPAAISITASAADQIVCQGQCTDITIFAAGGATNAYDYFWDMGFWESQPVGVSAVLNTCPTSMQIYSFYAVNDNGCTSTSQTLQINVYDPLAVVAASSPNLVCVGDQVTLSAVGYGGNGNYQFNWDNGESGNDILATPLFVNGLSVYSVSLSDGCSAPIATAAVSITASPTPEVRIVPSTADGCVPLLVSYVNSLAQPNESYFWDFGDESVSTVQEPTHSYLTDGTFAVLLTVTSDNGCQNTGVFNYIDVHPIPLVDFTWNPATPTWTDKDVRFYPESDVAISSWNWTFYGLLSEGANVMEVSSDIEPLVSYPADTGYYPVELAVTSAYGCVNSTSDTVFLAGELLIYIPNAFSPNGDGLNDYFFPKGYGADNENYGLRIYNRWGQLIYFSEDFNSGWDGTMMGVGGDFIVQNGVYVYHLELKPDPNLIYHESAQTIIGSVTLVK